MPHYRWSIEQDSNLLVLHAFVPDGLVRRLISKANSFPPGFTKNFVFEEDMGGFEAEYDEPSRTLRITAHKVGEIAHAHDRLSGLSDAVIRAA
jgi:hypothetical protein